MANVKYIYKGIALEPQASDPSGPVEGQIQYADGTARTEGLWFYSNGAWTQVTTGIAGAKNVTSKTANYTATTSDDIILVDCTSGDITITLPTAVGNTGKIFVIKKTDTSANEIVIDGNSSETIDGALTKNVFGQFNSVEIISNGTNWSITKDVQPRRVIFKETQTANTSSTTALSSATYVKNVLNTTEGEINGAADIGATLSSSVVTLKAGKYRTRAVIPTYVNSSSNTVCTFKARLRNTSDSTTPASSNGAGSRGSGTTAGHIAGQNLDINANFTLTASKNFEVQTYVNTTTNTAASIGLAVNATETEVYTQLEVIRWA